MTKIRIPVKGKDVNATVVIDPDDVEDFQVSSHRGFDSTVEDMKYVRTLNGQNSFTVTFIFKNGKKELWVESPDPQEGEKP